MQNTIKNKATTTLQYKEILSKLENGILVVEPLIKNYIITDAVIVYANNVANDLLELIGKEYINDLIKKFINSAKSTESEIKLSTLDAVKIKITPINTQHLLINLKKTTKKHLQIHNKPFNIIINKQGYITHIDTHFIGTLKYSRNEMLGKQFQNFLHVAEQWQNTIIMLEQKGHAKNTEILLKDKNGEIIPTSLDLETIYNSYGRGIAYKGSLLSYKFNKTTNSQHLENITQKLNTTEKIAKLVAHEVRNPITNINLALAQLEQDLSNNENKHSFCIDVIRRNCSRINMLVNQLLNTSVTEFLHKRQYSINDLVNDTLKLASDRIRLNEIAIIKILTKQKNIEIDVDVDKIITAFLNIIINAIEAMEPQKGILTIQTDIATNAIIITIKDNGLGIEQQRIQQIFNPFYTNKEMGMGLGLTSANNIINSHNGEIKIWSIEKKGSIFSIYFYK